MPVFWVLREKDRMRGYKIRQLAEFGLLTPTLSATAPGVALAPTSPSPSRVGEEVNGTAVSGCGKTYCQSQQRLDVDADAT